MSSHNNVLKLLGRCLELPNPMLVYEYVENKGPLNAWGRHFGCDGSSLSWKTTLKVAKDIANAVTYLHTAFPRPIIHLNIKLENVFLDKNLVAKLSNFSCSLTIPEGESVVKVEGMDELVPVFIDPVYVLEGDVSEQSDVYSFGIFLLVLLTRRRAYERDQPKHKMRICDYVIRL
ncbi:hypothetical protein TIFTF001_025502 [Ficus carica]|uniref:Protein kinase domain-containing protein n=1 Tax=Ficus carica TaxID=3494 RepID=A0AA88AQ02_FICCA|nr:hypothetical protein TIFTF001_025502 [Ficus carica]